MQSYMATTVCCVQLIKNKTDLKKKVRVTFSGEPGVDMGGLTKEWFLLLLRKIFRPEYGTSKYIYNAHILVIGCRTTNGFQ